MLSISEVPVLKWCIVWIVTAQTLEQEKTTHMVHHQQQKKVELVKIVDLTKSKLKFKETLEEDKCYLLFLKVKKHIS